MARLNRGKAGPIYPQKRLGRLRGVADEGGWWPEFASNAEALDTLVEAIERATLRPGEEIFSAKFTDAPLAEGKFETHLSKPPTFTARWRRSANRVVKGPSPKGTATARLRRFRPFG